MYVVGQVMDTCVPIQTFTHSHLVYATFNVVHCITLTTAVDWIVKASWFLWEEKIVAVSEQVVVKVEYGKTTDNCAPCTGPILSQNND